MAKKDNVPDFIKHEPEQDPENVTNIEVGEHRTGPVIFNEIKDVTEVSNKDDDYHYRWVQQKNVPKRKRQQKYEVVHKDSKEEPIWSDEDAPTGKTIGGGDLVLMKTDKRYAEAYQKHVTKDAEQRRVERNQKKKKAPVYVHRPQQ